MQQPEGSVQSLATKASKSAVWSLGGFGAQQVVRLGSNLVLTRLLVPEDFGLMALVQVFLTALALFSDIGIGPAVIQHHRSDRDFLNTIWTLQVFRGLAIFLVAFLLASPYADFYEDPRLLLLIQVSAVSSVADGFRSTSFFTLNRELNVKPLILLTLGTQLVTVCVMIPWAAAYHTVWAIVAGSVAGAVFESVLSHIVLDGQRNWFRLEREALRFARSFGVWIFVATAITFTADNLDRLIFGKLSTLSELGVYSIAALLATVPSQALGSVSSSVLFPLYSRIYHSDRDLQDVFNSARWAILVLSGWVSAGWIGGGPTIVRILYDERYWDAGWMMQALVSGLWFGVTLQYTNGAATLAAGRSDLTSAYSFAKLLGISALIPLGYWLYGFPGAVLGLAASDVFRYAVSLYGVRLIGLTGARQDLGLSARVAASALTSWLAVVGSIALGIDLPWIHAGIVFVVATAFWVGPLSVLIGRFRRKEPLLLGDIE